MSDKKSIPQQPSPSAKKRPDASQVKKPDAPPKVKNVAPAQPVKQAENLYSLQEGTEPEALQRTAESKSVNKTVETRKIKKRTEIDTRVRRPKPKVKSLDTTPQKSTKKNWSGLPSEREEAIISIAGGGALGLVFGLIHWFTGARIRLLRFYDLENPFFFPGESILFLVCLFALLGYLSTKTSRV